MTDTPLVKAVCHLETIINNNEDRVERTIDDIRALQGKINVRNLQINKWNMEVAVCRDAIMAINKAMGE